MTGNMFENYTDILSVGQLCPALDIGRNTAYKLLNSGTIKSIRIGKTHKIPKIWVMEYINNATVMMDCLSQERSVAG